MNKFSPSLGTAGLGSSINEALAKGDDRTPHTDNDALSMTNRNALTNGFAQYTVGHRVVEFTVKYNF